MQSSRGRVGRRSDDSEDEEFKVEELDEDSPKASWKTYFRLLWSFSGHECASTREIIRTRASNHSNGLFIEPDCRWYSLWTHFILLWAVYSSFFTPLEFAFFRGLPENLFLLDIAGQFAFLIDIVVRFFVVYRDPHSYSLVYNHNLIAIRYLRSRFVIDFLGCLPWDYIYKASGRKEAVRYLLWIRLSRALRVTEFFEKLEKDIRVNYLFTRIIKLFVVELYCTHTAACIFYYLATTLPPARAPFPPPSQSLKKQRKPRRMHSEVAQVSKSHSVKLKYVKLGYQYLVNHILTLLLIPTMVSIAIHIVTQSPEQLHSLWNSLDNFPLLPKICCTFLIIYIATLYYMKKKNTIYLVDFACFKPPCTCRVPFSTFMEHARIVLASHPKSVHFQMKILERSGLGEETCLPPAIHYIPPAPTMDLAREEAELVIFSAMDSLLEKTRLKPRDIDILIVNCSLFSPTPSLSAMVVNKYKLRSNIKSFNLSGMGCSAGLISMDLARDLLQVHPNSNAVVVSTEIITPNLYMGNERSMMLPNCLFRMGGAAILLSNRWSDWRRAKYRLLHVVRTNKGADDKSYNCVQQTEDSEGNVGISLSIDLMRIAGDALKSNITTIGPLVLPASEQLLFLLTLIGRKIFKMKIKPYIPDFKQAFEHFCIHAGGRAVIDELQKSLRLEAEHVEASRMTLHRFGNTSSSSLWYEMSYIEAKGRMKKGDRIWQIAFGSGFKCNSAVWKCNRAIKASTSLGPWVDSINDYPVYIPEVVKL